MSDDIDTIRANTEINDFAAVAKSLTEDQEIKDATASFARAFCVMVLEFNYLPKAGKFVANYQNYRVLVGG